MRNIDSILHSTLKRRDKARQAKPQTKPTVYRQCHIGCRDTGDMQITQVPGAGTYNSVRALSPQQGTFLSRWPKPTSKVSHNPNPRLDRHGRYIYQEEVVWQWCLILGRHGALSE